MLNSSLCSVTHVSSGVFWYPCPLSAQGTGKLSCYYVNAWLSTTLEKEKLQIPALPVTAHTTNQTKQWKIFEEKKRKGAENAWWCKEEGRKLAKTMILLTAALRSSLWSKNILIKLMSKFKKCPIPQNHPLETLCFEPAFVRNFCNSLFIPHW